MMANSNPEKSQRIMKVYVYCLAALLLGAAAAKGQEASISRDGLEIEEGMEVLTRGPVHEAFAETIMFNPEPGIVVEKPVPELIEELPPEQKPEGANVDWIPGYWAWDDERDDFLWVSGVWRTLPPGRQWIPGYWSESGRGFQWISGYWADAQASEIDYLPEPPETVEVGPNVDAPSADHIWVPGCWVWRQNRYLWRPGFWTTVEPNWVWIPAHYVWSPRGYVFVNGYYDHVVPRRGLLFAPVYFTSNVYSRRGFSYSPLAVINPAVLTTHLFLRPNYGHYYFGDYYGSNYASSGYSPWFSFFSSGSGYDPFYAHQRWHHRSDRQWEDRLQADFARRRDQEGARPPRTWRDQLERSTRDAADDVNLLIAAPLGELSRSTDSPIRFQPVAQEQREQFQQRRRELRAAREQRQQMEAEVATDLPADTPAQPDRPLKGRLPKSPIAASTDQQLSEDATPPPAIEGPEPDAKIEPKPRRRRDTAEVAPQSEGTTRKERSERPRAEPKEMSDDAAAEAPKGKAPETKKKMAEQPKRKTAEQSKKEAAEQPKAEQPKRGSAERPKREPAEQPKKSSAERRETGGQPRGETAEHRDMEPAKRSEAAEQPRREPPEQPKQSAAERRETGGQPRGATAEQRDMEPAERSEAAEQPRREPAERSEAAKQPRREPTEPPRKSAAERRETGGQPRGKQEAAERPRDSGSANRPSGGSAKQSERGKSVEQPSRRPPGSGEQSQGKSRRGSDGEGKSNRKN
ncbi:MAG: YXWGXW repeat-containing protein [Pirellulaceae bacterium]